DGHAITFVGTGPENGPPSVDGAAFPPQNSGFKGYTIDEVPDTPALSARHGISPLVAETLAKLEPDIVLLMIGTNDVQHDVDLANAPKRLAALLDRLLGASPRALLAVAQIPPTTDAELNPKISAYNAALAGLVAERSARGRHIVRVDVY